jgi:hypothetical protein
MLCPICGKTVVSDTHKPFCCRRCADVDLNRWFTGSYALPVVEDDDEDGDHVPPQSEGEH